MTKRNRKRREKTKVKKEKRRVWRMDSFTDLHWMNRAELIDSLLQQNTVTELQPIQLVLVTTNCKQPYNSYN